MRTWRLILALICGLLMTAAFVIFINPDFLAKAEKLNGSWQWKAGGWIDYAPALEGVPDFDQKQASWGIPPLVQPPGLWTYCGPVAMANSLWWFDTKFEPYPLAPTIKNDNYFLISTYNAWQNSPYPVDDHDPKNVGGMDAAGNPAPVWALSQPSLVDELAWYFDTDGQRTSPLAWTGTRVQDMFEGLQWWLYGGNPQWLPYPADTRAGNFYDEYHVQMVQAPTWEWVVNEVERSEDVVLLLGFYNGEGMYDRLGGHFVTVAGIDSLGMQIGLSDPYLDFEESIGGTHVFSGTLPGYNHSPIPGHPTFIHNDAGNISHDVYSVALTPPPLPGRWAWELLGYNGNIYDPNFGGQNTPAGWINIPGPPSSPLRVFVEYAIAVSPFTWKPGGEWVYSYGEEWGWEWWAYEDDGDSCIPDFHWSGASALPEEAYDGPTALADSLWWFDFKAETLLTQDTELAPPDPSDHYPLVSSILPVDDHDPENTIPLINLLADTLQTTSLGTTSADMAAGVQDYLEATGSNMDFYTKTQTAPSFDWVADEVIACEDVVMLLGFYEELPTGDFQRKGGHWVDVAGVNKESKQVGISDPWDDWAWVESFFDVVHTGRVFPPEQLGDPFTLEEKKEPQSISHEIYFAEDTIVPGYQWELIDYPIKDVIGSAIGMNGGGVPVVDQADEIVAVVEWAIGVSPYSDLLITKTAKETEFIETGPITYTIEYMNIGFAAVNNVVITDNPPVEALSDLAYSSYPPLVDSDPGPAFSWSIPKLSFNQKGVITVTATIAEPLVSGIYTNTATITTLLSDRSPTNNISKMPIFIDSDPPETIIDSNPPDPSSSTSPVFIFHGDDGTGSGIAGFLCKLNSGSWGSCSSPKGYTIGADGYYTFTVYATDNFGLSDATPAKHTWLVDTTPPTTSITSHPADPSGTDDATFDFTGADPGGSGVTSFECKLDSGSWSGCSSGSISYTGLSNGSHTFYVQAKDAADNVDLTPDSYTWTVDVKRIYLPTIIR